MSRAGALTAITYHYVRPRQTSPHVRLTALDLGDFTRQVDELQKSATFVGIEAVNRWISAGEPLPPRPVLLTFDDGYVDHYTHVRPVLLARHVPALFFLPGRAIAERVPLEANLIQFVIGSAPSIQEIEREIESALRDEGIGEPAVVALRAVHRHPAFFDDATTTYVKRLLQFAAPEPARSRLLDTLFRRYVSDDPMGFADDLYLSRAQAEQLLVDGFHLGAHGWSHQRLTHLDGSDVDADVQRALAFAQQIDPEYGRASFCYPFGAYSDGVVDALERHGVRTAFTVDRRVITAADPALRLPRLDANDLRVPANSTTSEAGR